MTVLYLKIDCLIAVLVVDHHQFLIIVLKRSVKKRVLLIAPVLKKGQFPVLYLTFSPTLKFRLHKRFSSKNVPISKCCSKKKKKKKKEKEKQLELKNVLY